jgi:branched-chain amino acid transport system permease protein
VSAANWRGALNVSSPGPVVATGGTAPARVAREVRVRRRFQNPVRPRHVVVLAVLLAYPWLATPFFTYQIGAQALALGLIALSLTFLGGYGGMISLAQMTVAGIAGYMLAIFGTSASDGVSLGWPWWLAALLGIAVAVLAAAGIGWLSVRTEGIYTIMITLAIGVAFYYLALQNYAVFNGFQGKQKVFPPTLAGIYWRDPTPFYYLTLVWALAGYLFVVYLLRTPFGIALQGIRDNPRRMHALGFNVTAHRVAAYAVAGAIAAVGGVLFTWYNGLVTPGSVGTSWLINILVIAVLGGLRHPVGPFLGAIVFVLVQNFAIDVIDRERFNLVIGAVFLVIVLFSRDGLLGWWAALSARLSTQRGETPWRAARGRSYAR